MERMQLGIDKVKRYIGIIVLLIATVPAIAQEICDNGIDDDNDGLIDFQDDDCQCDGVNSFYVSSIIPNPSFEEMKGIPTQASQLDSAKHWRQATMATTDYYYQGGYMGAGIATPPLPFPDGDACAGIIVAKYIIPNDKNIDPFTNQDYLGTNLLSPLEQDTTYTLELSVGFGTPDPQAGFVETPDKVTIALYGLDKKANFPKKTMECITKKYPEWELIKKITVHREDPVGWVRASMDFTPLKSYQAIMLGGECTTITDTDQIGDYVFIDNLILSKSSAFTFGAPTKIGSTCDASLKLKAPPVNVPVAYQWYRDGVAIVGEFAPTLFLGDAVGKSGDYSVVISSGTGHCAQSGSIHIDENSTSFAISGPTTICGEDSITLDAGPNYLSYAWSTGETSPSIVVSTAGTYSVTVKKGNGCEGKDTVVVNYSPQITLSGTVVNSDYTTNNGSIDLTVNGGIKPYSYSWSNSATTQDIQNLADGEYIVHVKDKYSCAAIDTFTVLKKLTYQITPSPVLCAGESTGSIKITVIGGLPPYTIFWPTLNKYGSTVNNLPAGQYDFVITDSQGKKLKSNITVEEPEPLIIDVLTQKNPLCFASANGEIAISVKGGTGPYNISWNYDNSNSLQLTDLAGGIYTVTVTDRNNCTIQKDIELIAPEELQADFRAGDPTCYGLEDGFIKVENLTGGTRPYTYFLNSEEAELRDLNGLAAGNYLIRIVDKNKCEISENIHLQKPEFIEVKVNASDFNLVEGDSALLFLEVLPHIPDNFSYMWKTDRYAENNLCDTCAVNVVRPTSTTTYTYVLSNGNCVYTDAVKINVEAIRIYMPNVFSPNGDAINDVLLIGTNRKDLVVASFQVFDRWGARVYSVSNVPLAQFKGWDGTFHNQQQLPGTYYYKIDLVDARGKHFKRQSTITILR